jgi:hypothetical protein
MRHSEHDRYVSRTLDADARVPYWDDSGAEEESDFDTDGPAGEATAAGGRDSTDSPVVSGATLEWTDHDYSDRGREDHRFRRTQLGAAAGSRALGVSLYPDDGKVGLFAGSAPGGESDERILSTYLDADAEVDYWSE